MIYTLREQNLVESKLNTYTTGTKQYIVILIHLLDTKKIKIWIGWVISTRLVSIKSNYDLGMRHTNHINIHRCKTFLFLFKNYEDQCNFIDFQVSPFSSSHLNFLSFPFYHILSLIVLLSIYPLKFIFLYIPQLLINHLSIRFLLFPSNPHIRNFRKFSIKSRHL